MSNDLAGRSKLSLGASDWRGARWFWPRAARLKRHSVWRSQPAFDCGESARSAARPLVHEPLLFSVRAIDALLTCGKGQRIGLFSAAGVGKSTLLGMMMHGNLADVVILALVG